MKPVSLLTLIAAAALTVATPFSKDDTVTGGIDVPTRGEYLARRENEAVCHPSGVCYGFMKHCTALDCAKPFTLECDAWCRDRLCTIGPEKCRKDGECGFEYCGSKSTGVGNIDIPGRGESLARREDHGLCHPSADDCFKFLNLCAALLCAHPQSPECTNGCREHLCLNGPTKCRKGGACGFEHCDRKPPTALDGNVQPAFDAAFTKIALPDLALTIREERDMPGAKAEVLNAHDEAGPEDADTNICPSCTDWIKTCRHTQCVHPWGAECQWECQQKVCTQGPGECRKGGKCSMCE